MAGTSPILPKTLPKPLRIICCVPALLAFAVIIAILTIVTVKCVQDMPAVSILLGALDIIIGKGPSARSIRLDLPHFTLIGATTRAGQLSAPLRDRFGVIFRLEMYTNEQLASIVKRSADILNIPVDEKGAMEIASRSRGTPRIANRLLKRSRDFAQVKYDGIISREAAIDALERMEIDNLGLDNIDRILLTTMIKNYNGGPVGLDTIAAAIGEESVTIEDVYEPYLMQIGFLSRTPRGRCATALAYKHLGLKQPGQQTLI